MSYLTGVARAFFAEHGWYVSERLFDAPDVDVIKQRFDAVLAGQYSTGRQPDGVDSFGGQLTKVSQAHWADRELRRVVFDKRIACIAAELLETSELYLWSDSLYWKAPRAAGEAAVVGWHQDKQYWPMSSSTKMITACIALYPATALNGGMRFAMGSHRWGLVGGADAFSAGENSVLHLRPKPPTGHEWIEQCPALQAGQVTFHHSLTFHGSGPNLSDSPRRSITIHMVSGEAQLTEELGHTAFEGMHAGDPFRPPKFPKLWPPEVYVAVT